MSKRNENSELQVSTKIEKYFIDWPEELRIDPIIKVEISPTRSAWVYKSVTVPHTDQYGRHYPPRDVYLIHIVITKTGLPPRNSSYGYNNRLQVEDTLVGVRLWLQGYSMENQPKSTKTVNQKVTVAVDNEDDDN